jgi:hypothetical protein
MASDAARSQLNRRPHRPYPGMNRRIPVRLALMRAWLRPLVCGSDSYTVSKLLKKPPVRHFRPRDSSSVFLRLPQGSLIVHSFCTSRKCFSVAARNILAQSGFIEHVVTLRPCRTMIAAKPVADWQFSRVNCRGELETRASACRLPGHCGLLYSLFFGPGWAAGHRRGCRGVILGITVPQPVLVNVALLVSAVGSVPSFRCF